MNSRRTRAQAVAFAAAIFATTTILSGTASAAGLFADPGDVPDGVSDQKVLLIDIDGVRWDRLQQANTPNMDALAAEGQIGPSYIHGVDVARTDSGPGHSNLLTGTWPDKHGVVDNRFEDNNIEEYPDLLTRLESARSELSTFSILDWEPLNEHLVGSPDVKVQQSTDGGTKASDRRTTDWAVEALGEQNPDLGYVYLHDVDHQGHENGADSSQYVDAVETVDGLVGELVDSVRGRDGYDEEDWLFVVTTDHGFDGTSHGTNQHRTREIWTLAAGGGVPAAGESDREWKHVDVKPTVLDHLGVDVESSWDLDGVPIGTSSNDPFDTMRGSLQDVVDEPDKPDDLLGWTKSTPDGWEIDEETPDVGATEYRGWSFMTGQFWATSHIDQGRESFFRGRDVVAVADPDEWDDKGNPTQDDHRLDSTLLSPWQDVSGGQEVEVGYYNHYRQVDRDIDPQKVQLVLIYDTGDEEVLWSADSADGDQFDISTYEQFNATAPDDAEQVRVGWHMYDAANNFYWAIDDPEITVG
ncbi:MAG: alkaline phosphatase family protein [Stackebrandtia sp.]